MVRQWNTQNSIQPNPGSPGDGSTCTVCPHIWGISGSPSAFRADVIYGGPSDTSVMRRPRCDVMSSSSSKAMDRCLDRQSDRRTDNAADINPYSYLCMGDREEGDHAALSTVRLPLHASKGASIYDIIYDVRKGGRGYKNGANLRTNSTDFAVKKSKNSVDVVYGSP